MLYVPGIFGENLMSDWMNDLDQEFFGRKNALYGQNTKHLMKTDVRENEADYEIDVELPGYGKEDIQLSLENGYLLIKAEKDVNKEEKDEKTGKIIRQERYTGSMSRSFFVGKEMREEDIKARLDQGVLSLRIPKKDQKPALPEKKIIAIE